MNNFRYLLSSTALTRVGATALGIMVFGNSSAFANPVGGQVVGGSASIVQVSPTQLDIVQSSSRAVIDWQSFSIGANETTQFIQPGTSSIAVNRVTGVDPSQILGRLTANGQVVLVNPNGILFGRGARVDVGGLVASTSGITTQNAMAGKMIFDQGGNANATIENDGRITARDGGLVALVAPSVVNNGIIQARLGKVSLASGDKWTLDLYGDNLVSFDVTDKVKGSVTNTGTIRAGSVAISANAAKDIVGNAINMGGVVEATSVHQDGGTIILDGGDNGDVNVTGKLLATGNGANAVGGTVEVTGNDVSLSGATVDASGNAGGGTIAIGGGAHGSGALHHASNVTVDANTQLLSDALLSGNGGSITVWSDGETDFYGSASAKGGFSFGNGGSIETSGHDLIADPAKIDTSAANGTTGNWLLDPYDLSINASGAAAIDSALAGSNVTVQTSAATSGTSSTSSYGTAISGGGGNISVNSAISWSSANSLTLSAYNSILVNANISDSAAGNVVLRADNTGVGTAVLGSGNGTVTNSATVSVGGAVSLYYDPSGGYASPSTFTGLTGTGGVTKYMLVNTATDLQNVANNLTATYALGGNIAAVGAFTTLGSSATPFTGLFDGNGGLGSNYSIGGATITGTSYQGLFGDSSGKIRNVTVTGETVSAAAIGVAYIGGLVGYNTGTISNASVTGTIIAGTSVIGVNNAVVDAQNVGGLVGYNTGTVSNASFTGTVIAGATTIGTGNSAVNAVNVGGLVGYNIGVISAVTVTGGVTANTASSMLGGLVGYNDAGGTINGAQFTGTVSAGSGVVNIGGVAGTDNGTLSNISVSGAVSAGSVTSYTGALVGSEYGSVSNVSSNAAVVVGDGSLYIGGYFGQYAGISLSGVTATGAVTAGSAVQYVGGFAGDLASNLSGISVTNTVTVGNNSQFVGGITGIVDPSELLPFTAGSSIIFSGTIIAGASSAYIGGLTSDLFDASIVSGTVSGKIFAGSGSQYVGGLVGENDYAGTVTGGTVLSSALISVSAGTSIGGLVGYNNSTALLSGIAGSGTVIASGSSTGVGGAVGFNNASYGSGNPGGEVLNVTAGANVQAGTGSTGVGGIVGINGFDSSLGGYANQPPLVSGSTALGSVSVGVNSFAVGGIVGWNQSLTNLSDNNVYSGSVTGNTGSGAVTAGAGSTYVHGSTQIGCDQTAGCAGTPGQQVITVTANAATTTYGTATTFSYTDSGTLESGDSYSGILTGALAGGGTAAGTYSISQGTLGLSSPYATLDYTITFVTANETINKAHLTVTPTGTQLYGGSGTVSYAYAGLVNGDASGVVSGVSYTTPVTSNSTVGTYGVTATGGTATNYTITDATGVYTVNKAAITITPTGTQTYGSAPTVSYTYTGLINGDSTTIVTGASYSTSATSASNAGSYSITAVGGMATNYTIVDATGTLTINKALLTITPTGSQVYGSANTVSYTYSGLVNGNTSSVVTGVSYTTPVTTASTYGTYGITATGGTATNYTITDATGVDTVSKALLTVTPTASQTYGGSNAALSYTYAGLVNGDTSSAVSGISYTTPVTSSSSAGTYGITTTGGVATNYIITDATGVDTVNKAALTITPTGTQSYGGANTVSYAYAGLVNSDTSSAITGVSYTTPVTTATNAGTYAITATGGTSNNYIITDAAGVDTVNKVALTVTPTGSQVYGSTNTVSFTYTGLVNGNTSSVVTGVSYTTPVTTASTYGTYGITATGGTATNYTITDATGVDTVSKALLTITPTGSQTYGGTNVALSYTYAGLVNGDASGVVSGVSYTTPVTSSSSAGTYGITTTGGVATNYIITDATGVDTVNKAALTITPTGTQTYGAANTVSYGYAGLVNGDTSSAITGVSYTTPVTTASNVGTYAITAAGGTSNNYIITNATGVDTVSTAMLTITPTGSQVYGSANTVSFTYTGLVNGNTSGVVTGVSYTTPVTTASTYGTYGITATGGTATNYTITDATGVDTVSKALLTITPTGSQTYGGTNVALSYTYAGLVNGDASGVVSGVSSTTLVTSSSSAGVYGITATGGAATNYIITDATGVDTVNKAALTITPTGTQTYGASNTVSYGYAGLVNGDTSSAITGVSYTTPVTTATNAGTYAITAAGGTSNNYIITDATGVDTVNKALLTITPTGSQVYGSANTVSFTYTGLANGNTSSVVSGVSYTTPVTTASTYGTYGITATGGTATNYTITDATGVDTVSKALLTITPTASQTYGGSNAALSYTYAGLVNGDASGVVSGVSSTTPVTSSSAAGTYGITTTGGVATNYIITDATGVDTVNQAALTITVAAESKTYGTTDPTLSYTATGYQLGQTSSIFTGTLSRAAGQNVGTYVISQNTLSPGPNYVVTFVGNSLSITPAGLTITPTVTQSYGGGNRVVSYTYAGLANNDTSSVVSGLSYTSSVTNTSTVGTYGVTATGGTAGNYVITDATGSYTVNPANLVITANGANRLPDQSDPVFTASYAGLVNGNSSTIVTGLSFVATDTSSSPSGYYQVTPSSSSVANYSISYVSGTLIVLEPDGSLPPLPMAAMPVPVVPPSQVIPFASNANNSALLAQVVDNQINAGGPLLVVQSFNVQLTNLSQFFVQNLGSVEGNFASNTDSGEPDQLSCLKVSNGNGNGGCDAPLVLHGF